MLSTLKKESSDKIKKLNLTFENNKKRNYLKNKTQNQKSNINIFNLIYLFVLAKISNIVLKKE